MFFRFRYHSTALCCRFSRTLFLLRYGEDNNPSLGPQRRRFRRYLLLLTQSLSNGWCVLGNGGPTGNQSKEVFMYAVDSDTWQ